MGNQDPTAPGENEKNFETPAGVPDAFDNEGPGGFAQEPQQTAPAAAAAAPDDDPLRGTPGGSAFLQKQRAPLVDEIRQNPELYGQVLGMALTEDDKDPAGPIESLFNRANYSGMSLRSLLHPSYTDESGQYHQGFYGPINTGMLPDAIERLAANDDLRAKMREGLQAVIGGSNRLKGATDQGMAGDRNAEWQGGRIMPVGGTPSAIYNDWGGGPGGHAGAATWRQQQQAQIAQEEQAATTPQRDPAVWNKTADDLNQWLGPVGAGRYDGTQLPATVRSPQPTDRADAASQLDGWLKTGTGPKGEKAPPPGTDWSSIGASFKELLRGVGAGFVSKLGLPADTYNFINHFYNEHPKNGAILGAAMSGGALPPDAQEMLDKEPDTPSAHPIPRLPLGAEDIMGAVKWATGLDLHQQDQSTASTVASDMGQFIGAGATPVRSGIDLAKWAMSPSAKTALSAIIHHIILPAGASGGLDAGKWAVDDQAERGNISQGTADAIGIGTRIALGLGGVAAMGKAGEAKQALKAANTPAGAADRIFSSLYPNESAATAAKASAASDVASFDMNSVAPGYEAPAAMRTSSMPIQQWFQNLMRRDMQTRGRLDRNVDAMSGMAPGGDAQDAVSYIQRLQQQREQMINMRVDQARQDAEQQFNIAQQGSQGRLTPGDQTSKFDLGQAFVNELRNARDDAFAHADDQWDVARAQGFTGAQAPVRNMYAQLEGLMGENVRLRQGADFPWSVVNDLYEGGAPQTNLFDKLGNRRPGVPADPLFQEGNTTLEQLKGLDSRLGNAIRMEQDRIAAPGNGGNPVLLRNLSQVRGTVWQAIEDGAIQAGNHTSLRAAMDATAQAYQHFSYGDLGRLLNERGGAANAPQLLQSYLGNSQSAIRAADAFEQAITNRTGAAAIRAGDKPPPPQQLQQQVWNTLSDWMRQDYLNTVAMNPTGNARVTWMQQHQGFFDRMRGNPTFDALGRELGDHANSTAPATLRAQADAAKTDQRSLDNSAASLFLGRDGQGSLDTVFKAGGPQQKQMMGSLIQDAAQDSTGRAFRGLQRMLYDRVMLEAERTDPLRPGENYYSFGQAKQFMEDNKAAFDTMRRVDPAWGQRLDRFINSAVLEDRVRVGTGLQLPPAAQPGQRGFNPGENFAKRLFQIGGGNIARRLLGGSGIASEMQATGQGSGFASQLWDSTVPKGIQSLANRIDPVARARAAIEESLFDPEKFRGMLAPVTGPSGKKWAAGIEPWLKASGVMLPQGWLNPEQQMGPPGPPQAEPAPVATQQAGMR